jgi:hypothetical protein
LADDGFGGRVIDLLSDITGFVRISYYELIFLMPAVMGFAIAKKIMPAPSARPASYVPMAIFPSHAD